MNPDVGPRCGGCRLGLGVHNTADPLCVDHSHTEADCDDWRISEGGVVIFYVSQNAVLVIKEWKDLYKIEED